MDFCVGVATPHSPHVKPFSSPINHTFSKSAPDVQKNRVFKTLDCLLALVFSSGNSNANVVFNAGPSLVGECKPEEKIASFRLAWAFFFPSNGSVSDRLPAVQSRVLQDSSLSGLVQQLT